jgi:hypothetical protein
MNKIFLVTLGACALAGNLKAETVFQQVGRSLDTLSQAAMRKEMREEAYDDAIRAEAAREAKSDHEKQIQAAYRAQDLRNQARAEAFQQDAKANPAFYHTDALPLSNLLDDEATIRVYLHDLGYQVSAAQISQIRAYMQAQGINHVSGLGR